MDTVDNLALDFLGEEDKIEENKINEDEVEIRIIKSYQGIAESNLMVIPFISMKRTKVKVLKRVWVSNGIERGITVKGSADLGVPTTEELDLLLALFRIHLRNMGNKYEYNRTKNTVSIPKTINFTYKELAIEMGYNEGCGGSIERKLKNSIMKLVETTIYSELGGALRDVSNGEYITEFEGIKSFGILKNYKFLELSKKIGNAKYLKEMTSVDIDSFFYNSMRNNYFKIYDYSKYLQLKLGISKKLFLLLNQWSHGFDKFLSYQVLYDMLSLDSNIDNSYNNREIKKGFGELKKIGIIDEFEPKRKENGIYMVFNKKMLNKSYHHDKYNTDDEIIGRLHEIGLEYEEITKYFRLDNSDYVKALLRYIDKRQEQKNVANPLKLLKDGLKKENYVLDGYYN